MPDKVAARRKTRQANLTKNLPITTMEKSEDVDEDMSCDSLAKRVEYYKLQTNEWSLQIDQRTATELAADLVSMFGQQIILPKMKHDYHGSLSFESFKDIRRYISLSYLTHLGKERKEKIGKLMTFVENIAQLYNITKNQWQALIYMNIRESNVCTGEQPIAETDMQQLEQLAAKENVLKSSLGEAVSSLIAGIRQWKNKKKSKYSVSVIPTSCDVPPRSFSPLIGTYEEKLSVPAVEPGYTQQEAKYSHPYSLRQPRRIKYKLDQKEWQIFNRIRRGNQRDRIQKCGVQPVSFSPLIGTHGEKLTVPAVEHGYTQQDAKYSHPYSLKPTSPYQT